MIDYTILYRTQMARSDPWSERWDLFISSFNSSERVKVVFDKAQATEKKWLIHEEYDFDASEAPANAIGPGNCDEARFMHAVFNNLGARRRASVCVDITGMLTRIMREGVDLGETQGPPCGTNVVYINV